MLYFENPYALSLLALIALIVYLHYRPLKRRKKGVLFLNPMLEVISLESPKRSFLLLVVKVALVILLVLLVASPVRIYEKKVEYTSEAEIKDVLKVARPAVLIVIDVSGSMGESISGGVKMDVAKQAIKSFLKDIPEKNDVGLIAFSHTIVDSVPPVSNRTMIVSALESLQPDGGTMYTYPLTTALNYLKPYRVFNQSCMVVFVTDGMPADLNRYDHLLKEFKRMQIPVYTVYIGPNGAPGEIETKRIAEMTGGKQYTASTAEKLSEIFEKLASTASKVAVETKVSLKFFKKVVVKENISWILGLMAALLLCVFFYLRYRIYGVIF